MPFRAAFHFSGIASERRTLHLQMGHPIFKFPGQKFVAIAMRKTDGTLHLTTQLFYGRIVCAMKTSLVGFLLCGIALAQTKTVRVFLDTADPGGASNVSINDHLAPSHGEQIRNLNKFCPALQITDDAS